MDKDTAKPAIQFFTTEEILEELFNRNLATVVCRIPKNSPAKAFIRTVGGRFTCLGLVHQAMFDMLNDKLEEHK